MGRPRKHLVVTAPSTASGTRARRVPSTGGAAQRTLGAQVSSERGDAREQRMGLGLGIVVCLGIFVVVGFMVFQAYFAARQWRRVIAAGDVRALDELLDQTFEGWRNARPPRGVAPADWRAMHTAALIAADHARARVSLLAEPDVRVVGGERVEVGTAQEVARRAATRMVERLLYEVPYVSFAAVQVDVHTEYRSADGQVTNPCLLTTRATREVASWSDWEGGADASALLAEWDTREATPEAPLDPAVGALISADTVREPGEPAAAADAADTNDVVDPAEAIRAAERAIRERRP